MNDYYKDRIEKSGFDSGVAGLCFLAIILILIGCAICNADVPDILLDAIDKVESGGNAAAVGDGGRAVGAYQIWKIYVDDVNRIVGLKKYGYEDRRDAQKSRDMVRIYLGYYATEQRLGHDPTFEDYARIHNGGPSGWKKEATKKYWMKVKKELNT